MACFTGHGQGGVDPIVHNLKRTKIASTPWHTFRQSLSAPAGFLRRTIRSRLYHTEITKSYKSGDCKIKSSDRLSWGNEAGVMTRVHSGRRVGRQVARYGPARNSNVSLWLFLLTAYCQRILFMWDLRNKIHPYIFVIYFLPFSLLMSFCRPLFPSNNNNNNNNNNNTFKENYSL